MTPRRSGAFRSIIHQTAGLMRVLVLAASAAGVAMPRASHNDSALHTVPDLISNGDVTITVRHIGPPPDLGQAGLHEWIERSARIVSGYFRKFPVGSLTVDIITIEGSTMGSGRTFGYPQPRIEVRVGRQISRGSLEEDWVLVHEMTHLALPAVDDERNWFAEGVAVYVEGIARAQSGNLSEALLWDEYWKSLPKGLPQAGDGGLDRTHTWARTYWGGALYCFLSDVRIHTLTNNRRGLQDALRAVARDGGGMSTRWPIERVLAVADAATGTTVMADLYRSMKDQAVSPDLAALWADLGVQVTDGAVHFNDSARLAAVRQAITRPREGTLR